MKEKKRGLDKLCIEAQSECPDLTTKRQLFQHLQPLPANATWQDMWCGLSNVRYKAIAIKALSDCQKIRWPMKGKWERQYGEQHGGILQTSKGKARRKVQ